MALLLVLLALAIGLTVFAAVFPRREVRFAADMERVIELIGGFAA